MEGLQDFYNAWIEADCKELEKIIKSKSGITTKKRELKQVIYGGKVPKEESVPYKYESMINFLAGGKMTSMCNKPINRNIYKSNIKCFILLHLCND